TGCVTCCRGKQISHLHKRQYGLDVTLTFRPATPTRLKEWTGLPLKDGPTATRKKMPMMPGTRVQF
ncbi:hypothetical protein, partial [Erwinia persicina]|uniref:hypothetical protein n=1 Tax=Erwinia persicina TaxID=55211 RepID=UPI001A7E7C67